MVQCGVRYGAVCCVRGVCGAVCDVRFGVLCAVCTVVVRCARCVWCMRVRLCALRCMVEFDVCAAW